VATEPHPAPGDDPGTPEEFFAGHPDALALYRAVHTAVTGFGAVGVRTTRSQVAFRRRTGFAWLWLPGRWLRASTAEVVLSVALGRPDPSPRWKEVVHPSGRVWMHHLEASGPADVDAEVVGWLREAYDRAG
jgi:hypothetical protein